MNTSQEHGIKCFILQELPSFSTSEQTLIFFLPGFSESYKILIIPKMALKLG